MKNNIRPISNGSKGFPKHTVCMSGYPKKTKAEKTKKKYNKNKIIALILLAGFIPALIAISVYVFYVFVSFVK